MTKLAGKVAWITGAGSGIGEAAAISLSNAGAAVVLTGRRPDPLETLAARIRSNGGEALVANGDVTDAASIARIMNNCGKWKDRLDILINNAGGNIRERQWEQLTAEGINTVLSTNLSSAFYCSVAAMNLMRPKKDGVLIHTASWAGRFITTLSGPVYTAAKHAVIAMSHSINMEEFGNGIRSTAILPAEVATPILDLRPQPPSQAVRDLMLKPSDLGELILFIATRPRHVCLNEITISPTQNRLFVS
jgi:NADP-dependent 3-hydroxy acid dehydrogenase YdfG